MSYVIEVHAIQSLPPSNVNRDESGAAKTAIYGGVTRARVSSQSWKQAIRRRFEDTLDRSETGVRTKRVVELLAERIKELGDHDTATAAKLAEEVLKKAGVQIKAPRAKKGEEADLTKSVADALVFFSNRQLDRLAEVAVSGKASPAAAKKAADMDHGVEVGLFGRMVAKSPDLKVDSAVQVAHAISTHAVEPQADFYTAVDDHKEDGDGVGAGMMGTIEFNSSTLYRYAALNLDGLQANLTDPAMTARAAKAFVEGFLLSLPTGKVNTFGNNTLPAAVLVTLRKGRSASLVDAFEEPVVAGNSGLLRESVERMASHYTDILEAYGDKPEESWVLMVGDRAKALADLGTKVDMEALVAGVEESARARLGDSQ